MSTASTRTRLSPAEFEAGARRAIDALDTLFLYDEDLADDLDAVLGEPTGPVGLVGPWLRPWQYGLLQRRLFKPSEAMMAEVGRALTRLDRMLARLIVIAKKREWMPPYPNLEGAIARAVAVRALQPHPVGDFARDRARLRRLAMAAADLRGLLAEDGEGAER
ncbi:hypothetical protein ACIQD1_11580 [Streptomyces sp. NPDC093088]|uniref:hypothetical protein n=1 Tax=Streptomyces sp. NPDC093088 TaxID=3366023 RepID=UPI0037FA717B